jgi:hypothetical protein
MRQGVLLEALYSNVLQQPIIRAIGYYRRGEADIWEMLALWGVVNTLSTTTSQTLKIPTSFPQSIFVFWAQTAIIFLYSINPLISTTETKCFCFAAWTESSNTIQVRDTETGFILSTWVFPCQYHSTTHHHLHAALIKKANFRRLETFRKSSAPPETGKHWIKKYFRYFFPQNVKLRTSLF